VNLPLSRSVVILYRHLHCGGVLHSNWLPDPQFSRYLLVNFNQPCHESCPAMTDNGITRPSAWLKASESAFYLKGANGLRINFIQGWWIRLSPSTCPDPWIYLCSRLQNANYGQAWRCLFIKAELVLSGTGIDYLWYPVNLYHQTIHLIPVVVHERCLDLTSFSVSWGLPASRSISAGSSKYFPFILLDKILTTDWSSFTLAPCLGVGFLSYVAYRFGKLSGSMVKSGLIFLSQGFLSEHSFYFRNQTCSRSAYPQKSSGLIYHRGACVSRRACADSLHQFTFFIFWI